MRSHKSRVRRGGCNLSSGAVDQVGLWTGVIRASAEGLVKAWSRAEAVEMLMQETKDLIEEWRDEEELNGIGDDSGVLVDVEEPRSPLS